MRVFFVRRRRSDETIHDLIPEECRIRTKLRNDIEARLDSWGYEEVITPTVEFYKTYEAGFDNINEQDMYKFFDAQGRILMLRADMTIPIARLTDQIQRCAGTAAVSLLRQRLQGP